MGNDLIHVPVSVRKEYGHAEIAVTVREIHCVEQVVGAVLMQGPLLHHLAWNRGTVGKIEPIIFGQLLIELIGPGALEVDGVDQKHDDERIDGLLHDVLYLAVGVLLHPCIDDVCRLWSAEIHPGNLGVEVLGTKIQEFLLGGPDVTIPY